MSEEKGQIAISLEGVLFAIIQSILHNGDTPGKAEPELFICDHAKGCMSEFCSHRRPHERWDGCNNVGCDSRPGIPAKCIPYKEPTAPQPSAVPTSGTGTTPEDGRTLKQTVKDLEICTYPGMAKDIGDLTLRMDNLEMLHGGVGQKIGNFQKELKDQREDYHAHIRQFVEENAAAHKEINKALKSLKEDSSAELSQFARDTNQVLHEHKQINDTAREVSNERAVAIYIQMQDQIKGLEHRLRLAQDRIAEIHPSGCVPHVKSKPKSRLKTDRVKKVK